MAKRYEVYRCSVCGNVIEVVHHGEGILFCCGRAMQLFSERTVDIDAEPYAPIVQQTKEGIKVTVGVTLHDMAEDHHIQWIEVISDHMQCRKYLKPGAPPEATFNVEGVNVRARAYCTQHGLYFEKR